MAYRLSVDIKSGSVQRLSQFAGVVARAADCGQRGRDDRPLRQAKPNRDSIHQPYWYPHASEALWARVMAQLPLRLPIPLSHVC
jgi:hypothetical protein